MTARAPAKLVLLMVVTINIILRAVRFSGVSSAYFAQLLALSGVWQSVQFKLSEAEKKPIVSMNSSTGIPLRIWTSLKTSSAICGFCSCAAWPLTIRGTVHKRHMTEHTKHKKEFIELPLLPFMFCSRLIYFLISIPPAFVGSIRWKKDFTSDHTQRSSRRSVYSERAGLSTRRKVFLSPTQGCV